MCPHLLLRNAAHVAFNFAISSLGKPIDFNH